ncbi:venom allergen 5.01 isoform X2 [Eurytemora carolleeae]|uniref:venom allergen 5.01 isoform X2 n=1 Tax=Eurytemora carolleeae TaxID=1294199 RepID=UPI000C760F5E|nr:venom allergen 5.01 isoform X2 [Eurytemora carolleeae]|eukprot:XP_023341113.1 venom allergen 5.01-like isoform X2 [Eurytemora affinis]
MNAEAVGICLSARSHLPALRSLDMHCLLLILVVGVGQGLGQENYCQITPQHTLCKHQGLGAACGSVLENGLGDQEISQILDHHNRLRSRVAVGSTEQPPASNMLVLTWDTELARIAQALAETCKFQHDCSDCRFRVGQNIYQSFTTRYISGHLAPLIYSNYFCF